MTRPRFVSPPIRDRRRIRIVGRSREDGRSHVWYRWDAVAIRSLCDAVTALRRVVKPTRLVTCPVCLGIEAQDRRH